MALLPFLATLHGFCIKQYHTIRYFPEVLDHQVAAYVKGDFLSNFLYILIIFKQQIPKDDSSKLNFLW